MHVGASLYLKRIVSLDAEERTVPNGRRLPLTVVGETFAIKSEVKGRSRVF